MNFSELFLVAITHRTAPFALRERLSLAGGNEAALAGDLATVEGLVEFVIVSTCNRVEIYGVAQNRETIPAVAAVFCHRQNFDPEAFSRISVELRGEEAVRHLLEVACGFDSQILGETEIFGQIKKAYALAQNRNSAGAVLNRVFQKAFQIAKQVRSHPSIASGVVSSANVAVDLAVKIFGGIDGARILLLGAGEMGTKSGRAFASRGASSLTIASRRQENAATVAAELGGSALPFADCTARLHEFDIVVCSTAAPETILSRESVAAAMRLRPDRPIFFIDLAMPRDVDPAVAQVENVFLYNLEDLARIADANRSVRAAEMERCRPLLAERTVALWRQVQSQLTRESVESAASTPSGNAGIDALTFAAA